MTVTEERTNAALRALDHDLLAGHTTRDDYRRRRRELLRRLRLSLEATLDVTIRRSSPSPVDHRPTFARSRRTARASPLLVAAWTVLACVIALGGWLVWQLCVTDLL